MEFETLKELINKRKGYKYLDKDGTSPYQNFKYDGRKRIFKTDDLDEDTSKNCAAGFNLATLGWILADCSCIADKIIVEYSIPDEATIIVPKGSSGKFRTNIIKKEKTYHITDLVPEIKGILKRLEKYKPINPINAEKLPPKRQLKSILSKIKKPARGQIRDQVGDQVRDQICDQFGNQIWDQVWAKIWDQVGSQVRDQICDQFGNRVEYQSGNQFGSQFGNQVEYQSGNQFGSQFGNQVWDQVGITAYFAVKEFLNLDYDHPAFDLIRLGVFVIKVLDRFKVFGKNGKFLGEFN
jgi:hypothetical protein